MHRHALSAAGRVSVLVLGALVGVFTPSLGLAEVYRTTSDDGAVAFSDNVRFLQGHASSELRSDVQVAAAKDFTPTALAHYGRPVSVPFAEEHGLIKVNSRLNAVLDVPFYVDTGTSDVMIPLAEAKKLGFCESCKNPQIAVMSITGVTMLPVMELESVALGSARVSNVRVIVNRHIEVGLLGRGFLKNFVYTVDDRSQTLEFKQHAAR